MPLLIKLGVIALYSTFVSSASVCNKLSTCGECIGYASERCAWCSQEVIRDGRCQPESYYKNVTQKWCNEDMIYNPDHKKDVQQDKDFNSKTKHVVQFKPQGIKIKARPGVPVSFKMSYKPAEHFPLDVYYLMDNSDTMKSHKEELRKQANEIYRQLTSFTNNVQLGVGSFVEKPGLPYVDKSVHNSYAFKNHLSLTKNVELFTETFKDIPFGANWDDPEAGLDALMQAMVCEKEIGWRNSSRRIIVLFTDSTYHSVGDGKMIGIIKPNDMKCHLNNSIYDTSLTQDYPSVSQINTVATRGSFKIIFAALEIVSHVYTFLANQILGAKYAELKANSNIVEIIKEAYLESVRNVELNYELPRFVQLALDPDCKAQTKQNCQSTHTNPIVTINATLTIEQCPPKNLLQEFKIGLVGISDKLKIELDIDCRCDCEKENSPLTPTCNNAGSLQCGICKCDDTSYGVECQCNRTTATAKKDDLEKCKFHPDDTKLCSGRGSCKCGKCECEPSFSGVHCEYDDNSCPRPNRQLCAGHGICYYGKCQCVPHWSGNDCNCPASTLTCIAPYSKEVCSGNGVCDCGTCKCDKIKGKNERYSGIFCDNCAECASKRCKELEEYAYCNYMNNKTYCDQLFNGTTNTEVFMVNKTEMNSSRWPMSTWCKKQLEDGTLVFMFNHEEESHKLRLIIQNELDVPSKANIWVVVGSAIGAVVLIGLLTVIAWKILVDMYDAREFKKFETEALSAGFDVSLNPLYQDPAINFSNPTYNTRN